MVIKLNWIKVESTRINEVSYDKANSCVYLKFKNEVVYCYFGISEEIYNKFMSSDLGRSVWMLGNNYKRVNL